MDQFRQRLGETCALAIGKCSTELLRRIVEPYGACGWREVSRPARVAGRRSMVLHGRTGAAMAPAPVSRQRLVTPARRHSLPWFAGCERGRESGLAQFLEFAHEPHDVRELPCARLFCIRDGVLKGLFQFLDAVYSL